MRKLSNNTSLNKYIIRYLKKLNTSKYDFNQISKIEIYENNVDNTEYLIIRLNIDFETFIFRENFNKYLDIELKKSRKSKIKYILSKHKKE